jgi:hypothetical protein
MVLLLPIHFDTTGPPVQCLPYFQQNTIAILPPLMIPKPQYLNVSVGEKCFTRGIQRQAVRQTVLKTIQFDRKASGGTIEIQKEPSGGMLAAELEPGEATGSQRLPKLPFLIRLFAAELPGAFGWIHPKSIA